MDGRTPHEQSIHPTVVFSCDYQHETYTCQEHTPGHHLGLAECQACCKNNNATASSHKVERQTPAPRPQVITHRERCNHTPGTPIHSLHQPELHTITPILKLHRHHLPLRDNHPIHNPAELAQSENRTLTRNTLKTQQIQTKAGGRVRRGEVELINITRGVLQGDGAETEVVKKAGGLVYLKAYFAFGVIVLELGGESEAVIKINIDLFVKLIIVSYDPLTFLYSD